jgi:hypothetical protein
MEQTGEEFREGGIRIAGASPILANTTSSAQALPLSSSTEQ